MDIAELLDNILYELMTMNALRALEFRLNPCLSKEEREFVAEVASSVIEANSEEN